MRYGVLFFIGVFIGVLLLAVSQALCLTATVTGVTVTLEYDEPNQNTDGSPVADLDHCTLYYNMGAGDVAGKMVPASSPTGNGHIQTPLEVPVLAGMERNVDIWATASDTSGNESPRSNTVNVRLDRLAPGPPK